MKKETKAEKLAKTKPDKSESLDFANDLIKALNKDFGQKIAYNLSCDESPTHVSRWISTNSRQLDFICRNDIGGGLPEGRIIEIFGPPSIGKSHIAAQICKSTQKSGGIAVYIDSESATSVENLKNLGVDISKRFVYVDAHCTEEILAVAEKTILRSKELQKDVPVCVIWDSVAASSPKQELEGDYDKDTIGLQARVISKGMRKITGVIAQTKSTFVILNQIRDKVGVLHGDPTTTPGGKAIPFHASIRIKLGAGSQIVDEEKNVIGINVSAKTIKNKVAPPFRTVNFRIIFGQGIEEHEEMFDVMRVYCENNGPVKAGDYLWSVESKSGWKKLHKISVDTGELVEEKPFRKSEMDALFKDLRYKEGLEAILYATFKRNLVSVEDLDIDEDSYEEVRAVAMELEDSIGDIDPEG